MRRKIEPHFFSSRYDDIYFDAKNPEQEKQYVFLGKNRIVERIASFKESGPSEKHFFNVAELGFGFGLNYALTLAHLKSANLLSRFQYFSVEENFPEKNQIEALKSRLTICRAEFDTVWCENLPQLYPNTRGKIFHGDVLAFLTFLEHGGATVGGKNSAESSLAIDAWYLDGFSPQKNPAMWSAAVLEKVFHLTRQDGTFATYTAAGWVRRALQNVGFVVERQPGYGTKREMLVGHKP